MPGQINLAIVGATGSIGQSVLKVVERYPDRLRVTGMASGHNLEALVALARLWRPEIVAIAAEDLESGLASQLRDLPIRVVAGPGGIHRVATWDTADTVVIASVGFSGVHPTLAAIHSGKKIALANKETLVAAGAIVMPASKRANVSIAPIDSEHSAIWQCLRAGRPGEVRRLILTASGGPFRSRALSTFDSITPTEALAHPTWRMGKRITVDSATMMNKAFEIIEAAWLFDIPPERVDVVIHPQSIVHSMVEYQDGSVVAQMGVPDMTLPISYALLAPERPPAAADLQRYEPSRAGSLDFVEPDPARYPALAVGRAAFRMGSTGGAVLNAADEVAVRAFLEEQLPFSRIITLVESILGEHQVVSDPSIDDIVAVDAWARARAAELATEIGARTVTS